MAIRRYKGTGATLQDRWSAVSGGSKIVIEDEVHPAGSNAVNGIAVAKFVSIHTTAPTAAITDNGFHLVVLPESVESSTTKYGGYTYWFYEE